MISRRLIKMLVNPLGLLRLWLWAMFWIPAFRILLPRRTLRQLVTLAQGSAWRCPGQSRIDAAVRATPSFMAGRSKCLVRSLARLRLMGSAARSTALVIGVPEQISKPLRAHAWLERGPQKAAPGGMVPLARISSP